MGSVQVTYCFIPFIVSIYLDADDNLLAVGCHFLA